MTTFLKDFCYPTKKKKYKVSKPYYQLCPKCNGGQGGVQIPFCALCKGEGTIYHPAQVVPIL